MNNDKPVIGLFGTCGNSTWREDFIAAYKKNNMAFYNPQVPNETWVPEMAIEEANHLANDDIILFPITDETYAFGSLAETGFSLLQAISMAKNKLRFVITYVAPTCAEPLRDTANGSRQYKESNKARALVRAHLAKLDLPNLFVVENLETMLHVSMYVHDAVLLLQRARANPFIPGTKA